VPSAEFARLADRSRPATAPESGFYASFNCLWCGRAHRTRTSDDLEGWTRLCSECVGRAQDNEFLRFRLREGIRARARHAKRKSDDDDALRDYYAARAPEYDELYTGSWFPPVERAIFLADVDAATLWLDGLPISGEIVELAAGTGWWSTLLAGKGQLWLYDVSDEVLSVARQRLVAHGMRAHIHLRDAWTEPDRQVDALFCGGWLTHVARARIDEFLAICRRWLKPGGTFAFIDEAATWSGTASVDEHQPRTLKDGREFSILKVYYEPAELEQRLVHAGFARAEVRTTSRFFLVGQATA
jgi:SAM-dependent methyltransferase